MERGWVAPHLAGELPGLGIAWLELDCRPGRSPEPVRRRLRMLSDRLLGSHAVRMRERPIPWAYRVFFRHIGLDPDEIRTPVERLVMERVRYGGFRSDGLPADALTIATVETGVALRAFDGDRIGGRLGIRESAPGESLTGARRELARGTLTITDERAPIGLLFGGEDAEGAAVGKRTRRVAVVAIQVKGVPGAAVEEALAIAADALASA